MDYKKLYIQHFGYSQADIILCEVCGAVAVDIHHIECRGMGGTKKKENIENLIALCRSCHFEYGDKKQYKQSLKKITHDRIK